jgi:predicted  nucleic acid-binding Zn-ribbon protein
MPDQALATLLVRLNIVEKDIVELQTRLENYVPERENRLELSSIREYLARIESDMTQVKESHQTLSQRLTNEQEKQNQLQIKILVGTITTIIGLLGSILVGYITHFFK